MQIAHLRTKYIDEKGCTVQKFTYTNGRIALQLVSSAGEPLCTASVNLPDDECPPDHVFIKNWSENEGVLEELIGHGVISESVGSVRTGFVTAALCKVLI